MKLTGMLGRLVLFIVAANLFAQAQENERCIFAIPQDHCVYSSPFVVGVGRLNVDDSTKKVVITFDSISFTGFVRTRTPDGFEFRKFGHTVTRYPAALQVTIECDASDAMKWRASQTPVLPPNLGAVRVVVNWVDASGQVVESKSGTLRKIVEPWPELRPPRVWYVAELANINAPLAAAVEIKVFGPNDAVLGNIRGGLLPRRFRTAGQIERPRE